MPQNLQCSPGLAVSRPATISRPELMAQGTDDRFRLLVHRLLAFASRLEAIRAGFGQLIGLTGSQYTILICISHLGEEDGGVGVNQIADHLNYSGAFVTVEANSLTAQGLVRKRQNPDDRRRVLLTVSKKGRSLLARLAPTQRQVNDALFATMSKADFDRLVEIAGYLVRDATHSQRLLELLTLTQKARAHDSR
jgi:MarR family transcriptional regulator, organic hydroperoxide resistance regulator